MGDSVNGLQGIVAPGLVRVEISNGRRSPEEWARMTVDRILSVADTAPMPIREQAYGFKSKVQKLLEMQFRLCAEEARDYTEKGLF